MDSDRFDDVARAFPALLSRRGLAGVVGLAALGTSELAGAKKKRKRRRKKNKNGNKKPTPVVKLNAFGCVNTGDFCESAAQCCSGICTNAACQAHGADICKAGQSELLCADGSTEVACTGGGGAAGLCATTTGNAGVCVTDRQCVACKKDSDCQLPSVCGASAACIVCPNCVDTGGTACVASDAGGCA